MRQLLALTLTLASSTWAGVRVVRVEGGGPKQFFERLLGAHEAALTRCLPRGVARVEGVLVFHRSGALELLEASPAEAGACLQRVLATVRAWNDGGVDRVSFVIERAGAGSLNGQHVRP